VWGGATAFTLNGAPWSGKLDDGLFAAGGCNGGGISKNTLLGKRLAELITGHGDYTAFADAVGQASWIAPEPFRRIGYEIRARKGMKEAALEA
jgi:glycine/D-amino acid oxidase-like deaminating enzyme